MGLARQLPVAGLAERRPGPRRRLVQQQVEARPRHHQQPVGRAGARDGEAAERGVELVERDGAGQRVDRDGDAVRLPLVGVDGRAEQVAFGQRVLVPQPVDRVGGVVDGLVARREDRDERVRSPAAGTRPAFVAGWVDRSSSYLVSTRVNPAREQLVEQRFDLAHQRQVDVGRLRVREPVDLEQRRDAGADLPPRCPPRPPSDRPSRASGRRVRRRSSRVPHSG